MSYPNPFPPTLNQLDFRHNLLSNIKVIIDSKKADYGLEKLSVLNYFKSDSLIHIPTVLITFMGDRLDISNQWIISIDYVLVTGGVTSNIASEMTIKHLDKLYLLLFQPENLPKDFDQLLTLDTVPTLITLTNKELFEGILIKATYAISNFYSNLLYRGY